MDDRGFSLVEAVAAMALVVTVVVSVSSALVAGRAIAGTERAQTIGRAAAQARVATLLALACRTDTAPDGTPIAITDVSTDVAADPPAAGGAGLRPSPGDALWVDRPGYVDYLDALGRDQGSSASARTQAAFVRRWAIGRQGGAGASGEVVSIAVLVAPVAVALRAARGDPRQIVGDAAVVVRRAARSRQAS